MKFVIDDQDSEEFAIKAGTYTLREIAELLLACRYDHEVVAAIGRLLRNTPEEP